MVKQVAIFIDGAYLQNVLRNDFGSARIDFRLLSETLAGESDILRTYYYHCLPYRDEPPTPEQDERFARQRRFFDALNLLPRYSVRLGRLERRGDIFVQKRVDILLGVDMALLAAKRFIQEATLIAGDSDFIPAVSATRSEGVITRLVHGRSVHGDLLREVDERTQITPELINSVLMPS